MTSFLRPLKDPTLTRCDPTLTHRDQERFDVMKREIIAVIERQTDLDTPDEVERNILDCDNPQKLVNALFTSNDTKRCMFIPTARFISNVHLVSDSLEQIKNAIQVKATEFEIQELVESQHLEVFTDGTWKPESKSNLLRLAHHYNINYSPCIEFDPPGYSKDCTGNDRRTNPMNSYSLHGQVSNQVDCHEPSQSSHPPRSHHSARSHHSPRSHHSSHSPKSSRSPRSRRSPRSPRSPRSFSPTQLQPSQSSRQSSRQQQTRHLPPLPAEETEMEPEFPRRRAKNEFNVTHTKSDTNVHLSPPRTKSFKYVKSYQDDEEERRKQELARSEMKRECERRRMPGSEKTKTSALSARELHPQNPQLQYNLFQQQNIMNASSEYQDPRHTTSQSLSFEDPSSGGFSDTKRHFGSRFPDSSNSAGDRFTSGMPQPAYPHPYNSSSDRFMSIATPEPPHNFLDVSQKRFRDQQYSRQHYSSSHKQFPPSHRRLDRPTAYSDQQQSFKDDWIHQGQDFSTEYPKYRLSAPSTSSRQSQTDFSMYRRLKLKLIHRIKSGKLEDVLNCLEEGQRKYRWLEKGQRATRLYKSEDGRSDIICYLALKNLPDMIRVLLKRNPHHDINSVQNGQNALCCAVYAKNIKVVEELLTQRKTNVNVQTKLGYTPLMLSIVSNQTNISLAIIRTQQVKYERSNNMGQTPLHLSVLKNDIALVREIVKRTPRDLLDQRCQNGITAVVYGIRKGHREAVNLLITSGADLESMVQGKHALEYAQNGKDKTPDLFADICEKAPAPTEAQAARAEKKIETMTELFCYLEISRHLPRFLEESIDDLDLLPELDDNLVYELVPDQPSRDKLIDYVHSMRGTQWDKILDDLTSG